MTDGAPLGEAFSVVVGRSGLRRGQASMGGASSSALLGLPDDPAVAAVLLAAEDRRALEAGLLSLTAAPDAAVRARAALALGRTGLPAAAPRLLELLRDPDAGVRALAAFACGLVETRLAGNGAASLRGRLAEGLVRLVDDPSADVVARATWALGALGDASALGAVGDLLSRAAEAPEEVVAEAAGAWWRLPGAGVEALLPLLGSPRPAVRFAAARAVGRMDDPNGLPGLVPLLDDPEARVRAAAARGLRAAPARIAESRALPLLADPDTGVAAEVLLWLATAWRARDPEDPPTEEAVGAVIRTSLERDPHRRVLAAGVLGTLLGDWPVAREHLLQMVVDGDGAVRAAALRAFAAAEPGEARPGLVRVRELHALEGAAPGANETRRVVVDPLAERPLETAALVALLAAVGDEEAWSWVLLIADHGPAAARIEALEALRRGRPAEAARRARDWLEAGPAGGVPVVLQEAAAGVVAALHGAGALPGAAAQWADLLWEVQRRLGEEERTLPRRAVLDALDTVAPAMIEQRRTLVLESPERLIRRWGLENVLPPGAGPELLDAVAAPAATGRAAVDYRRLAEQALDLQGAPPTIRVAAPRGDFALTIEPTWAPLTALAFLDHVAAGELREIVVHRVVPDFVVQAGDPTGTGRGGVLPVLRSEEAPVPHDTGVVGMAQDGRDTGTSQFFIDLAPQPHLTGHYTAFARVTSGPRAVGRVQQGDVISLVAVPPQGAGSR